MKDLPLAKVYSLIEPGPVVLLATAAKGRPNVMTMSWHMMVEFEPPLIACVVSNANYSFAALQATRECVIAIPAAEIAEKVVAAGNCSGRDTDKFAKFSLTPLPAERVKAPLVAECFTNLECRFADTRGAPRARRTPRASTPARDKPRTMSLTTAKYSSGRTVHSDTTWGERASERAGAREMMRNVRDATHDPTATTQPVATCTTQRPARPHTATAPRPAVQPQHTSFCLP